MLYKLSQPFAKKRMKRKTTKSKSRSVGILIDQSHCELVCW